MEQPEDFEKMSMPELVAVVRQLEAKYAAQSRKRAEDSPPQDAPEQPEDNGHDA